MSEIWSEYDERHPIVHFGSPVATPKPILVDVHGRPLA